MKALLILPKFPVSFWGIQYSIGILGKRAPTPPLGLITVAALCPPDWQFRLRDLNIEELTDADLAWADVAMLSGMIVQYEALVAAIQRCKAHGLRTVVGGPHATSRPDLFPDADHLVLDEAEITLPKFLADLAAGHAERTYTANGEKPDVSSSPTPRFDLLQLDAYGDMAVQYSRGCPFDCEFCDIITLFGRRPRTKTPEQVLTELQALYDLGYRGALAFVDDNFIGNKRNAKIVLPLIAKWQDERGRPFQLGTEASINLAEDDTLVRLMREANFTGVFIGIETPSIEALRETKKRQNTHTDLVELVHKLHANGIGVAGSFIVGFDSDGPDIFDRQIEFIRVTGICHATVGMLGALPNTQLWTRLKREGRLHEEIIAGDQFLCTNFETRMPADELLEGYLHILTSIYDPETYFERVYEYAMRKAAPRPRLADPVGATLRDKLTRRVRGLAGKQARETWMMFARAFKAQGIDADYAHHYRKMLLRVWRERPVMLRMAVKLALMGYHPIMYTRDLSVQLRERIAELRAAKREGRVAAAPKTSLRAERRLPVVA